MISLNKFSRINSTWGTSCSVAILWLEGKLWTKFSRERSHRTS